MINPEVYVYIKRVLKRHPEGMSFEEILEEVKEMVDTYLALNEYIDTMIRSGEAIILPNGDIRCPL